MDIQDRAAQCKVKHSGKVSCCLQNPGQASDAWILMHVYLCYYGTGVWSSQKGRLKTCITAITYHTSYI